MNITEDEFAITLYTYVFIKRIVRKLDLTISQEKEITDIAIDSINIFLKNNPSKND